MSALRAENDDKGRPAANGTASKMSNGDKVQSIRSEATEAFSNAYAVLVIGKAQRRHLYFNLPAAQRAVDRAHARGDFADMALVRLVPVLPSDETGEAAC